MSHATPAVVGFSMPSIGYVAQMLGDVGGKNSSQQFAASGKVTKRLRSCLRGNDRQRGSTRVSFAKENSDNIDETKFEEIIEIQRFISVGEVDRVWHHIHDSGPQVRMSRLSSRMVTPLPSGLQSRRVCRIPVLPMRAD